jgi:hypothetical protein
MAGVLEPDHASTRPQRPSLDCSSTVTETPRSFLEIIAHNFKLAANIDHMRDDAPNPPSEPCPSAIVPEHGSGRLVRQRRLPVYPSVLFKFNFVRIDRGDRLECLASGTFGVDHAMALKLNVKIFDLSQVFDAGSGNGQIIDEINGGNQNTI